MSDRVVQVVIVVLVAWPAFRSLRRFAKARRMCGSENVAPFTCDIYGQTNTGRPVRLRRRWGDTYDVTYLDDEDGAP